MCDYFTSLLPNAVSFCYSCIEYNYIAPMLIKLQSKQYIICIRQREDIRQHEYKSVAYHSVIIEYYEFRIHIYLSLTEFEMHSIGCSAVV